MKKKPMGVFWGSCHHSHNSLRDRLNRYVVAGIKLGSCHGEALEPTQTVDRILRHVDPKGQWGGLVLIQNLDSNHKTRRFVCPQRAQCLERRTLIKLQWYGLSWVTCQWLQCLSCMSCGTVWIPLTKLSQRLKADNPKLCASCDWSADQPHYPTTPSCLCNWSVCSMHLLLFVAKVFLIQCCLCASEWV